MSEEQVPSFLSGPILAAILESFGLQRFPMKRPSTTDQTRVTRSLKIGACTIHPRLARFTNLTMATTAANDSTAIREAQDETRTVDNTLRVGRLVEVASRTWPGINKPGGVARIVEVHFDETVAAANAEASPDELTRSKTPTHVNVRYIVGSSREKRVPVEYVTLAPQYETTQPKGLPQLQHDAQHVVSLRDRSMLLGRCRRCGSLRTDCGSCDWAFEEEQAASMSSVCPKANVVIGNKAKQPSTTSSSRPPPRRNQTRHRSGTDDVFLSSEGESSATSDGDENDDMARLQRLIRQSQKRRKQQAQASRRSIDASSSEEENREAHSWTGDHRQYKLRPRNHQKSGTIWRRRYPSLLEDDDNHSSSSSSSEPLEFQAPDSKHSKRRRRMLSRSLGTARKHWSGGKSVLESLPAVGGVENQSITQPKKTRGTKDKSRSLLPSNYSGKQRKSTAHNTKSQRTMTPLASDTEEASLPSTIEDQNKHNKPSSSQGDRNILSDLPLNTTTRTNANVISYDQQLLELEARSRFQMEQQQPPKLASSAADADADFIQPEGPEAVETLPNDIVDRSRSIPYSDLGAFFDAMATKIEDEYLPDLKLKMADLHHRRKSLSAKIRLEECHQLWEDVRLSVIQNGTDQCRATLRRLMDDKLYRKHRKQLTAAQRRDCRGRMEARNLRLDALDEVVEALVRKLKDLVVTCEEECLEESEFVDVGSDADDSSRGGIIYHNSEASSGEDDAMDLLPIAAMAPKDSHVGELAPLDPHKHASRVRKEQPKYHSKKSRSSASKSSKKTSVKSRKRARRHHANENEIVGPSTKGISRRVAIQIDTSGIEGERRVQNIGGSTEISSHLEAAFSDVLEKSSEAPRTSIRNDTIGDSKSKRNRKEKSRIKQLTLTVPRDAKQSISERMQAFLDANADNGMSIHSEDEETKEDARSKRPRANHMKRRRQSSFFERNVREKGVQNDEPMVDARGGIEERDQLKTPLTSYDTDSLFAQLLINRADPSEEMPETSSESDLPNLYDHWKGLISDMEMSLSNNSELVGSSLKKAHEMLVSHGSRTIQDLISSKEAVLSYHIQTLSLCVRSLEFLSTHDVPIIFKREKQQCFMDFLVLQMVDALYSSSLPSAWALGIDNAEHIFKRLIPLRNALASRIPLVEAVSRCVLKSFGCQRWRRSQCNNHLFVSSLDPNCWSTFLQTGKSYENPKVTRFQKLGRVWPRIEIDALWRILAFIGAAPSISTDRSMFRLQIISKLFSSGVLAVGDLEKEGKLPPGDDQLLACQQEIQYFSSLIRKGVLDSLPQTDSMLVKLVQHSLQLQLDSFAGDDQARASCFPDSLDDVMAKKLSPMFWRMTHPFSFDVDKEDRRIVAICDFPFGRSYKKNEKTYKTILYPTSNLLMSCLSLIINWVSRVSSKKIRQNRLSNSLKALQNDFLKQAIGSAKENIKKADTSFEDAFSLEHPIEAGNGSERVAIFKQEVASYLQIIGSICTKKKIDTDLSPCIWKNMADEHMKKRQCEIVTIRKKTNEYKGDAYRLFTTTKVMATLVFVQMNLSPWHLGVAGNKVYRLFDDNLQMESESFLFPLSCIFACLDCLCDLHAEPHVFSQFYEIIILVFSKLAGIIMRGDRIFAADNLKSKCILLFSPILVSCIKTHLLSPRGLQESFHLRLCLSSIRAIYSFVAIHNNESEISSSSDPPLSVDQYQHMVDGANDDDMWGDLDDSDLASLDLVGLSDELRSHEQENLWRFLSDALEQSKPSKRFAISTPGVIGSKFQISSMGKYLIAEEVSKICDCFTTALVSLDPQCVFSSELTKIISEWIEPYYEDDEDSQYGSKIARKLTSELCLLAEKYSVCRNFVSNHADNMLFNFLKALMDSSRLEKLPSSNLERIGDRSGRSGMEQALLMLDLFNDESFQEINDDDQGIALRKLQNRRRKNATDVWDFCFKLGTAFAKNDCSDSRSVAIVGNSLLNLDSDLREGFNFMDDVISLENEVFKTFRLVRNITSYSAMNDASFATFEKVSSGSLMLLANHILSIVQSLKYNDQTSSDRDYKRARLTELLDSFVELFVSSAAWMLHEGAKNTSKRWSFLQSYVRDRLFSPILRKQTIDTTVALQEVITASKFVYAGPRGDHVSLPSIHCVGIAGCSKYLGDYFLISILRRSKQLLVASALNPQNLGLQNAILEAVLGSSDDIEEAAPWVVGTNFPLGKSRSIGNRVSWPYTSPIQKQIDEYMQFVDENLPLSSGVQSNDWWNGMATMKRSFLEHHVIPRLHSNSLEMGKKRRVIMLLCYILEHNSQSDYIAGVKPRERLIDVDIARMILKSLRSNLHNCLMEYSVDNSVARAIFLCSMHLTSSHLLLDGDEQLLVSWSHTKILEIKGKTILDLSNSEIVGSYVWIFFQWLRALGEEVIHSNGSDIGASVSFTSMRQHWRGTKCCRLGGMDEECLDLERSNDFETWDRLLIEFEDLAFPSKTNHGRNTVVNIYAKTTNPHQKGCADVETSLFRPWQPSNAVKKSLKELMAGILSAS